MGFQDVHHKPIVSFTVARSGPKCPFANETVDFSIYEGSCIWLNGNSGLGKTTLVSYLAGLTNDQDLKKLDIACTNCSWDETLPQSERCGILFQQTTLLDALTVASNIRLALNSSKSNHNRDSNGNKTRSGGTKTIKDLMDLVGLDYNRDANKRPTELSGGMARRASLALQLAQNKHVIVLDEPFAGLDLQAAISVAKELLHLRTTCKTAILLISHEPELAKIVMYRDGKLDSSHPHNATITLREPQESIASKDLVPVKSLQPNLFGISWFDRFLEKLLDYLLWSLPLIALTFCACGLAISMLSCDILARINVQDQVMEILDTEVKPFLKLLTGTDDNVMSMMMIKMKVKGMLNTALPEAKSALYAVGMAKLFCLEIGPLLTGLLLCGRIGASYAGKISTMQATKQLSLLQTLGISPMAWTLLPSLAAACLASPILTITGTLLALYLGALVGPRYGIGSWEDYQKHAREAIFPEWHLKTRVAPSTILDRLFPLQTTFSDSSVDTAIEITTYPPCFLFLKALTYILIIMLVAQLSTTLRPKLTPRGVPSVITSSVVIASLVIIVADWAFSQLWLQRY